jgi:hypothetical protein
MSSPTLPKPLVSDAYGVPIRAAVAAVAEQSFFALVDDCGEPDLDTSAAPWLVSVVRFDDGVASGSLACWLPPELAQTLFDSFSGRDPSEPAPAAHQIDDLVGEFSNMVCGDWLGRLHGQRSFQLSPPLVVRVRRPAADAPRRLWVKVNDRPLAVDWDLMPGAGASQNG